MSAEGQIWPYLMKSGHGTCEAQHAIKLVLPFTPSIFLELN